MDYRVISLTLCSPLIWMLIVGLLSRFLVSDKTKSNESEYQEVFQGLSIYALFILLAIWGVFLIFI